jgi:hypothetical protein
MPFKKLLSTFTRELQDAAQMLGGSSNGGGASPGFSSVFGLNLNSLSSPAIPQSPTPCPRQQPQANHHDWIGLPHPQFATFNVCPTCYHNLIRPTPYANSFVTKGPHTGYPPNTPVRCDMSRYWVRVAGMVLLTMNQDGRHDITLLARVAATRAQDGDCPNSQLAGEHQPLAVARRPAWYTLRDPHTGAQPLPGWTVCASCVLNVQACCPAIAAAFAPLPGQGLPPPGQQQQQQQQQWEGSCAMVPSDLYDDARTGAMLQQIGACAVTAQMTGRVDMSQLVNWLQANPPAPRGGGAGYSSTHAGGQPPHAGGNGLCPRGYPSTSLRCHTMQGIFDLTVCEQCYAEVVKPDAEKGVELARRFDPTPAVMPSGFTCQLYSPRMRQVWSHAAAAGDLALLQAKVHDMRRLGIEMEANPVSRLAKDEPRSGNCK